MLDDCKTKEERWGGVNNLIERWLQERQELIVLYCSITGINSASNNAERVLPKLRLFCQILVDYVSAGHFEVYQELIREAEDFKDGSEKFAEKLYPQIAISTEVALEFNDKYESALKDNESLKSLSANLSTLGEILVSRFDLEDQMIEVLHNSHADMVA